MKRFSPALYLTILCCLVACSSEPEMEFIIAVPWGSNGETVIMDSHTHTQFSDGELSLEDLIAMAVANGCTALAITDHGSLEVNGATPEYLSAIDRARAKFSNLILFAGVEWDIPPYEGREHVTVLLNPELESQLLPAFKARYEQNRATASEALKWLVENAKKLDNAVLIYNHPSRKDDDKEENFNDFRAWRAVNDLFIGFEGGPGHQKSKNPGAYNDKFRTLDRWDPVVAEVGGAWDQLLDIGYNVWGGLATSDYHNKNLDFPPCAFARTHIRVPEKNHAGVLRGLRAGSFWADHGRILDNLMFTIETPGFPTQATSGEIVALRAAVKPIVHVSLERGVGARDLPVTVELISNSSTGKPETVVTHSLTPRENEFHWQAERLVAGLDKKSTYFRARIGVEKADEKLWAYSNPIRLVLKK